MVALLAKPFSLAFNPKHAALVIIDIVGWTTSSDALIERLEVSDA